MPCRLASAAGSLKAFSWVRTTRSRNPLALPTTVRTGPVQSDCDPLAFAPITGVRFGNAGFNSLRGPGIANWDIGLFREFAATERFKIQFRAEAFNASNTPHFSNPGANVSNLTL